MLAATVRRSPFILISFNLNKLWRPRYADREIFPILPLSFYDVAQKGERFPKIDVLGASGWGPSDARFARGVIYGV